MNVCWKNDRGRTGLAMVVVVALVGIGLTGCDGIPASPTPRVLWDGSTVVDDNPGYMNGDVLDILHYWYNAHVGLATVDALDAPVDPATLLPVYQEGDVVGGESMLGVNEADAAPRPDAALPPNVEFARGAWFSQNNSCGIGITLAGAVVIFAVIAPPATLAAVITTWTLASLGVGASLGACFGSWQWALQNDSVPRWLAACYAPYLWAQDIVIWGDTFAVAPVVYFTKCVAYNWAALLAAKVLQTSLGAFGHIFFDNNGVATMLSPVCDGKHDC